MNKLTTVIGAALALAALAGCESEPSDACTRYCTASLDWCGPGSSTDVGACVTRCEAELEGKPKECNAAFKDYADCYYDDGDCEIPQCDDEFEQWSTVCYASGDLDGPFELTVEVDAEVEGSWDAVDPTLLRCQYPIALGAAQGGIGLMTEIWWSSETLDPVAFCGSQGLYNAGIVEVLGSQLIKAGEPLTLDADLACHGAFTTDWELTYDDPGGAEHTAAATVTCLEP